MRLRLNKQARLSKAKLVYGSIKGRIENKG
jgi:hypothetical protein